MIVEPPNPQSARENLLYIRRTLEAAGQLTAVPGKCLMAAGFIAMAGAVFNGYVTGAPWAPGPHPQMALATWGVVLGVSLAIVCYGIYRKSLQLSTPIQPPLLRKLLWSLCPALVCGWTAYASCRSLQQPGLATGHLAGLLWRGGHKRRAGFGGSRPLHGSVFSRGGRSAALSPQGVGLAWLALGFGWLHLVYGAYIARRHNG